MCNRNSTKGMRKNELWLAAMLFLVVGALAVAAYGANCTGPLDIHSPVYAGTKVIGYEHGTDGCPIFVYADGKLVGQGSAVTCTGAGEVTLTRALNVGETITAKQDPSGYATWSQKAPKVAKIPSSLLLNGEKFNTPSIIPPFVECQQGVKVQGLVEGVRANVTCGLTFTPTVCSSGSTSTPYQSTYVGVKPQLKAGGALMASQDMDSKWPAASEYSTQVTVQGLPKKLPMPRIVADVDNDGVPDVLVGSKALWMCDEWVGAVLEIYSVDQKNNWKVVGRGIVVGECSWQRIKPLEKGLKYCARQSLCELQSPEPTNCVFANDTINVPVIREPLCAGDIEVLVDKTAFNSTVSIQDSNNNDKGNATAPGSTTVIPVTGGVPLQQGDKVRAKQYNASLDSGWSTKWVTVQAKNGPDCEKRSGKPVCTPGKGTAKLWRDSSPCQYKISVPPTHAYQGDISISSKVTNVMLQRIINKSPDFRIKIVQDFNPKNPSGSLGLCESEGPLCTNTKVIATIAPLGTWNNINRSMYPFYRVKACLESVTGASFPLTVDIDYEYDCK